MLPLRIVPRQIRRLPRAARNGRLPCGPRARAGARGLEARGLGANPAGQEYNRHRLKPPLKDVSNRDLAKNFADFLAERRAGHRSAFGSARPSRIAVTNAIREFARGEIAADVVVPAYLPDNDVVRRDMLDYAREVEWGDEQFGRAIPVLEAAGELDNTLIVFTSDHGMPFPRVKGQIYDDGFHLPLAIRWGQHVRPGRVVGRLHQCPRFRPHFFGSRRIVAAGRNERPQFFGRAYSEQSGQVDASRTVC